MLSKVSTHMPRIIFSIYIRVSRYVWLFRFAFSVGVPPHLFPSAPPPPPTTTPLRMYLDGIASRHFLRCRNQLGIWNKRQRCSSGVPPVFKPALLSASLISSSFHVTFQRSMTTRFLPFAISFTTDKSNVLLLLLLLLREEATTPLSSHPLSFLFRKSFQTLRRFPLGRARLWELQRTRAFQKVDEIFVQLFAEGYVRFREFLRSIEVGCFFPVEQVW